MNMHVRAKKMRLNTIDNQRYVSTANAPAMLPKRQGLTIAPAPSFTSITAITKEASIDRKVMDAEAQMVSPLFVIKQCTPHFGSLQDFCRFVAEFVFESVMNPEFVAQIQLIHVTFCVEFVANDFQWHIDKKSENVGE